MKEPYTLKHLFLFCFIFLFTGGLFAQISNVKYEYSCPCRVTVSYELAKAGDVALFYSTDNITWMPADTFYAKTKGTHTEEDVWNCEADKVEYGVFYFKLERVVSCDLSEITMILVQGGTYDIGAATQNSVDPVASGSGAVGGGPQTRTVSDFYMSENQVTQAQFAAVMGANPSYFQGGDYEPSRCKPVEQVSWYGAITFCNKLSLLEGKTPVYSVAGITNWASLAYSSIPTSSHATWNAVTMNLSANGYRLPTEAEWEFAARGGNLSASPSLYYSGSNKVDSVGWYSGNNGASGTANYGAKPVGKKDPNALGLYDMSGNVYEWCWDWHESTYSSTPLIDYTGPTSGSFRMGRGGYWNSSATALCVSYRNTYNPELRGNYMGFRLVCSSQ